MTVGIAALCDAGKDRKFILCADRKISGPLGSAETMLKMRNLGRNWRCLVAGSDFDILACIKIFQKRLAMHQGDIDETNVLPIIKGALIQRMRDKIEELIQGKFAIGYDYFLNHGKSQFPEDIFRRTIAEVELIEIKAEFLIVGFIHNQFATLVQTFKQGNAVLKEDFAAIGEGAYLAHASLLNRKYHDFMPLNKALYAIYEAKKFSQGASSVGDGTTLIVFHSDNSHEVTSVPGDIYLETQRSKLERQEIPDDLELTPEFFTTLDPW